MDKLSEWVKKTVKGDSSAKEPKKQLFHKKNTQKSPQENFSHKKNHKAHPQKQGGHTKSSGQVSHAHKPAVKSPQGSNEQRAGQVSHAHKHRVMHEKNPHPKQVKPKVFGSKNKLKVIPFGGLDEVGKNLTLFEYGDSSVIIDMGLKFPEEDMLGIDYVIPDVSYLEPRKKNIKGILITHGHLDHIGAIPQLLPKLGFPTVYGTKLTIGLIEKRLEEFDLLKQSNLKVVDYDTILPLGKFTAEFFRVNHSIPDAMGIFLKTPVGNIVHSGDFKFDFTPSDNKPADFSKIARFGAEGVLAAFIESTNAEKPGPTLSEKVVGEVLDKAIGEAKGRVIITSFSTLIGRVQAIIDSCIKYNRKIFVSGRSMVSNIEIAQKLGYIHAPKGMIRKLGTNINNIPNNQALVLTTGSQGESMSALTRISLGEHSFIKLKESDTVILSSSPIAGNERAIQTVINNLCREGVKVISNSLMDVHTSGHAHADDLKLMYSLLKPKFLVPIHGMLHMRMAHKNLIEGLGMPSNKIVLIDNGDVLEISQEGVRKSKQKISANDIVIDGLGAGDIGTRIIQERKQMAHNGVVIVLLKAYEKSGHLVGDPTVMSRGFVYIKESREVERETIQRAKKSYNDARDANAKITRDELKYKIIRELARFFRKRLDREPMILPVIVNV